jgi:hypothetical protein
MMRAELSILTGEAAPQSPIPTATPELLQRIERLERYERRAFSRRKSAIRRLASLLGRRERP